MLKKLLSTLFFISLFITTNLTANKDIKMLDEKQQNIITISAFTATGELDRLENAMNEGLDAKLTISEIKEIFAHLYAYVGFPRSLNAQNLFMKVVEKRKKLEKMILKVKKQALSQKIITQLNMVKKLEQNLLE